MIGTKTISRRRFLKAAAWCGASVPASVPLWIPGRALGKDGAVPPSNRITLGFAGVGMMNRGHLRSTLSYEDAQVVAVSDPDLWRRESARQMVETRYAERKESGRFQGCDLYSGFHEMLDRPDIDGIVMATGENWHGIGVVMCAKAGKHIYVEKPSSLTIAEAIEAIEAVRRYGVVSQVGLQQRSWANFEYACKVVRSGALGKIRTVYMRGHSASTEIDLPEEPTPSTVDWDTWLGPAPRRPFNRRLHYVGNPLNVVPWNFCKGIGLAGLGANGSHAFDIVHWGLDCETSGPLEIIPRESGSAPNLVMKYPNDVTVHIVPHRIDPNVHEVPAGFDPINGIQHFGALFVGENGWIHVGRQGFLVSNPAELAKDRPARNEGHLGHVRDWLDGIKLRKRPKCDIDVGNHSSIPSILGCIAIWLARPLKWDPVRNEFPGDEEANRLRSRAIREPWIC